MPRFLCLHGHGTSAAIFKSQTGMCAVPRRDVHVTHASAVAFRAKLGASFVFDFVDAPFRSAPAPGVDVLFESGNFTWWPKATAQSIRAAHLWLDDYVEEHGAYDAVCCFSQGCALILSYMLYHAKERPDEPLPFKSAIFICGAVPFAVLEDLGMPVSQKAKDINDRTGEALRRKAGKLREMAANLDKIPPGFGLWDDTADLLHDPAQMPERSDVFGLDFTKFPDDALVSIPTVHIYGSKDPRWPNSMHLAHFCSNKTMYDHGGGHEIPRSTEVSLRIAGLVRQVTQEAAAHH